MNEFETLDEELSNEDFSSSIKSLGATIGQWAKIVAIVNIISQVLDLGISVATTGGIGSSLVSVGIAIALYVTLLKFGQAMSTFSEVGTKQSFADAMARQKVYWQFLGILMIIALFFLLLIFMISGGDIFSFLQQYL